MKRLLFIVNTAESFFSHRFPIALLAAQSGFEIHIATAGSSPFQAFLDNGFHHHLLPLTRSGKNPLHELKTIYAIYQLMQRLKPDIVHLVTIKPVLYGGIAGRLLRTKAIVMAIPGLGYTYTKAGLIPRTLRFITTRLYRFALHQNNLKVIFQNPDDRTQLMKITGISADKTLLLRGSGVSLSDYPHLPEPNGTPIVVMAARLLKDKGVFEFVAAAKRCHANGIHARFWLVGDRDLGNPETLSEQEFNQLKKDATLELLGFRADIATIFAQANIVVLPSYREGLPKVLQEAAACGRAVITTDVPGCREAIIPGKTGLLVPARNAIALADAIETLIENPTVREQFALAGRALATESFNVKNIAAAHVSIYQQLS